MVRDLFGPFVLTQRIATLRTVLVSGLELCCSTKMKIQFRDWSDIRVFLAVVREGSTLAASRILGVAQPTVARRIEVLEQALGLRLFERDTRGFRPTGAARGLMPLAEAIEAAAAEFTSKAEEMTETREIRITAYSANLSSRVMNILSDFSAIRPEVTFAFLPSINVLDLNAGEADIAFRLTRTEPDPDLICRKISTAKFALFGSRAYSERRGLPSSIDDFKGHDFVTFRREGVPPVFDDWLRDHVDAEQIVMAFSEIDLMHAAIRAGRGLGAINLKLAEEDPTLIQCFGPIDALSSDHLMLISREAYRRPEVKEFTKFFAPRYAAIFK